jgi:hypothetical protein
MDRRSFLSVALVGWWPLRKDYVTYAGVPFEALRHGASKKRRYLLIHGNEETARTALTKHMETAHGLAYLVTGLKRNVPIQGGEIDPNRLFSRAGAEVNLRKLNPGWSADQVKTAADSLDHTREQLVKHLTPDRGGALVAVHNNSEGYNVNEELANSDKTSIKEPKRPHEFFLCTDERDFEALAASPYNVVLQNKKPTEDDGSLSRLAAKRGFRYVNLETELWQYDAQVERLNWMEEHLS